MVVSWSSMNPILFILKAYVVRRGGCREKYDYAARAWIDQRNIHEPSHEQYSLFQVKI